MSFSTARISRLKVVACIVGALQLAGCAGPKQAAVPVVAKERSAAELVELFEDAATPKAEPAVPAEGGQVTPFTEELSELPDVSFSPLPAAETVVEVYHWDVVSGGAIGNFISGEVDAKLKRPVAVAVRANFIYIVDAGLDEVLRYDQVKGKLTSLLDLKAEVAGEVADIYVAKDMSFYITDTDGGRVLQYDPQGRLVRTFANHFNLTKPVSVKLLDSGDLVVADGHYDHILHFSPSGELLATYGGRGEGGAQFTNTTSMALGPDGFYVGARVGRRLQVVSLNGSYNYSFEEGRVIFPSAIVVDRNNRAYVADLMDNQIKVFDRGRMVATIGGSGAQLGKFMRVTDLWLDDRFLYVVDSLNARIQIARLVPEGVPSMVLDAVFR